MRRLDALACALVFFMVAGATGWGQKEKLPADDLTPNFEAPEMPSDYDRRVVMVPMRDGTKLYTVICVPKGAHGAPILLTRTPYNAASRAARAKSGKMIQDLPLSDEVLWRRGTSGCTRMCGGSMGRRVCT